MAVTLRERIRALLDSADEDESAGEADVDEAMADEDAEDAEVQADDAEDDEAPAEDAAEDSTPGGADDADDSAEDEDLRAVIREQAAQIETYRNRLAEAGLLDEAEEDAEIEADDAADEPETEDDAVEAFEKDYAERAAYLAEIGD